MVNMRTYGKNAVFICSQLLMIALVLQLGYAFSTTSTAPTTNSVTKMTRRTVLSRSLLGRATGSMRNAPNPFAHNGYRYERIPIVGFSGAVSKIPTATPNTSSTSKRKTVRQKILFLTVVFLVWSIQRPAIAASLPVIVSKTPPLGIHQLVSAAALLVVTGGLSLRYIWKLPGLSRALLQAAARCTLQLYLISGYLLTHFFTFAAARPVAVVVWIFFTGTLAAREAVARVEYTHPKLQRHMLTAIQTGGLSVIAVAAIGSMLGPVVPWFSPRAWIPVAGMLYGNTLTATALCAGTVTKELAVQRAQVELKLSRGATWYEALQSVIQQTLSTSLTPIMNALSVTGIVHIPGMMTGQLLAGQSPFQAAAYQVLIFLLIASQACVTVQVLMRLTVNELVDQTNDRLRTGKLTRVPQADAPGKQPRVGDRFASLLSPLLYLSLGFRRVMSRGSTRSSASDTTVGDVLAVPAGQSVRLPSSLASEGAAVLVVNEMNVLQTNMDLSLTLHQGDRIGIQGASGIGKSQILRTLIGLEMLDRTALSLLGETASDLSMPEWRRRVVLVPQNQPTLDGTPREFYDQVCRYANQQRYHGDKDALGKGGDGPKHPASIAEEWGLPRSAFDQSWSTLSGGESQRASLAIALALEPDVLLLDESTSTLDEQATLQIEQTLKRVGVPIIMVSHSIAQVDRFCSRHLVLLASHVESTVAGYE